MKRARVHPESWGQAAGGLPAVAVLLLLLGGCSGALAPALVVPHAQVCSGDGTDCLKRGSERFDAYRRDKLQAIRAASEGYRLPSAPVAFLHPRRTSYSVLLVHGLNDSAYYMADLAEWLHGHGYNVVTVLLPGHGTDTRDMLAASAEQWRAEVAAGLDMAALVGKRILMGGFSLGGILAIDAALRRSDIHGLLLFSPAVRLRSFDAVSGLACAPGLKSHFVATPLPRNPVKYSIRSGNGLCQLSRLIQHNRAFGNDGERPAVTVEEKLREMAGRLRVPTFVALSYADARIAPHAMLEFAAHVSAPVLATTFGNNRGPAAPPFTGRRELVHIHDDDLAHSFLVRSQNPWNGQENPHFNPMAEHLLRFVRRHFPPG